MDKNVKRLKELVSCLNYHRNLYYNLNTQTITDKDYDKLFDELKELEESTGIVLSNSPTVTVGYEVKSDLKKVKHSHPMLSLNKTKSIDELLSFIGEQECVLSCKADGLTVLLTYEDGKLVKAETRGNGEYGELITHNAKVFENIPLTINYKPKIEFEGEAIITYKDFEEINSNLSSDEKYKNPRNLVSGSVRQFDSSIAKDRHIKFLCWKVPNAFNKLSDGLDFAKKLGFDTVPYGLLNILPARFNEREWLEVSIITLKSIANNNSYPIDGIVCSYNDMDYGKSLGITSHHPKHSIAFKFEDEEYETKLLDIEWQLGKTGQVTPVAVFEPVDIDGATIEKASLSNATVLENTLGDKPHKGQSVWIVKKNEVIPRVERADKSVKDSVQVLEIPKTCPVCGGQVAIQQDNDSKILICTNPNCTGKLLGKLKHFVSKDAMNIVGLSEVTLKLLMDIGYIRSLTDLYELGNDLSRVTRLKHTNRLGEKTVDKLLQSIENSKNTTLDRLINAISIPTIGKSTAKDIAKYCDFSLDRFLYKMEYDITDFLNVNGVGDKTIDSMIDWKESNWIEFNELCNYLTVDKLETIESPNSLNGRVFVITGTPKQFKNRDTAKEYIENHGGKVVSSVTKKTNYLVNCDIDSNSSKNKKAKELGIPIITDDELIQLASENKQ